MSISKKGSRKIIVQGVDYRWKIRSKPTYSEALGYSKMSAVVELYDDPQSVLKIEFKVFRPDNWLDPHQIAITPKDIANGIIQSLNQGWDPYQKRSFKIELT